MNSIKWCTFYSKSWSLSLLSVLVWKSVFRFENMFFFMECMSLHIYVWYASVFADKYLDVVVQTWAKSVLDAWCCQKQLSRNSHAECSDYTHHLFAQTTHSDDLSRQLKFTAIRNKRKNDLIRQSAAFNWLMSVATAQR